MRIAAPQKCSLFSRRLTCHGNSPLDASEPPTILLAVCMAGRLPQSERVERASASGSCWLCPTKVPLGTSGKSCFSFVHAPSTCSSSRTLPGMSQGRLGKEHCKALAHHGILPETSKARNTGDILASSTSSATASWSAPSSSWACGAHDSLKLVVGPRCF